MAKKVRAGEAMVKAYLDGTALEAGLRKAAAKLKSFAAGVRSLGMKLAAIGGAGVTGSIFAAKTFSDMGDAVDKMSRRTGVGASALSEIAWAAEQSGASMESVEKSIRRMQAVMLDADQGLSTATRSFEALGLSMDELKGLRPEDQFQLITDRLNGIEDPSLKAALAMEIFGRSGTELLPMLNDMAALRQEARDLGLVISDEDAAAAAELNDAMNRLKRTVQMVWFQIGKALTPALEHIIRVLVLGVTSISKWIKEHKAAIVEAAKWSAIIAAAGVAMVGFGLALQFALTPLGFITLGVMGSIAAFKLWGDYLGKLIPWAGGMFDGLKSDVATSMDAIKNAMAAGDFGAAMAVGIALAKMEWAKFKFWLFEWWVALKSIAVPPLRSIVTAFQAAFTIISGFFEKLMVAPFDTAMRVLISSLTSNLKTLLKLADYIPGVNTKGVQGWIADTENDLSGRMTNAMNADTRKRIAEIEAETAAKLAEIGNAEAAANANDRAKWLKELQDAQAEMDKAREGWQQAVETAKSATRPDAAAPDVGAGPDLSNVAAVVQKTLESRGTFSAAATFGLGTGSTVTDRIADATSETARNTKRILTEVEDDEGFSFT